MGDYNDAFFLNTEARRAYCEQTKTDFPNLAQVGGVQDFGSVLGWCLFEFMLGLEPALRLLWLQRHLSSETDANLALALALRVCSDSPPCNRSAAPPARTTRRSRPRSRYETAIR